MNINELSTDKKKFISDHKLLKIDDMPKLLENFTVENVSNFLKTNPEYIDRPDKKTGITLLYRSVILGANDVTEFLLSLKANTDIPNINGETPLFLSVEESNHKIINLLLEAGANPNIQNHDGETPMHIAALKGDYKVIKLLLLFGANPYLRTFKNKYSPLDYANEKNKVKCIEVLEPLFVDDDFDKNFKNNFTNVKSSTAEENSNSNFKISSSSSIKKNDSFANEKKGNYQNNIETNSPKNENLKNLSNSNTNYFYPTNTNTNSSKIYLNREPVVFKSDSKINYIPKHYINNQNIIDKLNTGSSTSKNSNFQFDKVKNEIDFSNPISINLNNNLTTRHSKIPLDKKIKNHNRNLSVIDTKRKSHLVTDNTNNKEYDSNNLNKGYNEVLHRMNSNTSNNLIKNNSDKKRKFSNDFNDFDNINEISNGRSKSNNNFNNYDHTSSNYLKKDYSSYQSNNSNHKIELAEFDSFRNDSNFNNLTSKNKQIKKNKYSMGIDYEKNDFNTNISDKSYRKSSSDVNIDKNEMDSKFDKILLRDNSKDSQLIDIPKNYYENSNSKSNNQYTDLDRKESNPIINSNENSFREPNSFMKNMNNFEERLEKMKIDFIKNSTEKGKGLKSLYESNFDEIVNDKIISNSHTSLFNKDKINPKFQNFYSKENDKTQFINTSDLNQKENYLINLPNDQNSLSNGFYQNLTNKSLGINNDTDIFRPISPKNIYSNTTKNDSKNSHANNLNLGLNINVDLITTSMTSSQVNSNFNSKSNEITKSKFTNSENTNELINSNNNRIETNQNNINHNDKIRTSSKSINQTPNFSETDGKRRDFTEHLKNVYTNKIDLKTNNNLDNFKNVNNQEYFKGEDMGGRNKDQFEYNDNYSTRNQTKHQKNFTLFNNNFTNSHNLIENNEFEPEEKLVNNVNYNDVNNKKYYQKRNSYQESLNMNNDLNTKLNVDLNKISHKYLNINIQKNKNKALIDNQIQDFSNNAQVENDSYYPKKENKMYMDNNFNEIRIDNTDIIHNVNNNNLMSQSRNHSHNRIINDNNFYISDQKLSRDNENNNYDNFSKLGDFEVNSIETDDNNENNYKNFYEHNSFNNKNSANNNNNFNKFSYFDNNSYKNNYELKNDKSKKISIVNQNILKNNKHNENDTNFTLSNKDFYSKNITNEKSMSYSKQNKNSNETNMEKNKYLLGYESPQDNNFSEIGSCQNNENRIITLKPSEYIDSQEDKSINTRITYESNLNQNNLEDYYPNTNLIQQDKNKNYSFISSKVNENFWKNIDNKNDKKFNKIPISNPAGKSTKKISDLRNRNILQINNEFEEVQDSKSFEKNMLTNRILTHRNKESIYSENYYPRNEELNINNFNSGYYSTRKKSVDSKEKSLINKKNKNLYNYQNYPLKESFKELGKDLAIFFSSKNDIVLEDNKENILNYNESQHYVNKLGEILNNDEEEAGSNNINNVSNGNFIQETFNNNEENYPINTNRMIQRRKIKYFSKSNKSLKEEFKQISLDTQALDESLKNIDNKKKQVKNRNKNQTTTSYNSHLNTNLTKTNTNSNGNSNQKYVSLMNQKSKNNSNRTLNNYDYLLNQNKIADDLSQNNYQEDYQVYCNNSYLDFENDQHDSCLRTLDRDLNINKNQKLNEKNNKLRSINKNIETNNKNSTTQSNTKKNYQESYNRNDRKLELKDLAAETSNINENETPIVTEQFSEIQHFLRMIYLENYTNTLIKNGFDDINILINQMKTKNAINDKMLKDIGISVPGYRAKILIKLEEKAQIFDFDVPSLTYYSVGDPSKIKSFHILNDSNIKGIFTWLSTLKLEKYTKNLVMSGYHSMELLLIQMASK